jgi:hypothetical protein
MPGPNPNPDPDLDPKLSIKPDPVLKGKSFSGLQHWFNVLLNIYGHN